MGETDSNTDNKSKLVSGRAAAKILNVSPTTIHNWIDAGLLHPANEDNPLLRYRRIKFEVAELMQFKSTYKPRQRIAS